MKGVKDKIVQRDLRDRIVWENTGEQARMKVYGVTDIMWADWQPWFAMTGPDIENAMH